MDKKRLAREVKKVEQAFGIPMESAPMSKEDIRAIEYWYPYYEAHTYDEGEEDEE